MLQSLSSLDGRAALTKQKAAPAGKRMKSRVIDKVSRVGHNFGLSPIKQDRQLQTKQPCSLKTNSR
jgi:hypothetical protein